ncbi:hypothetical protein LAV82_17735 [Bacillus sp. ILBB4]|jgi:hypothetical protein|nr:hypothetical protein [Bacillus sp. ILBB4]
MALQGPIELSGVGLTIQDAYHSIESYTLSGNNNETSLLECTVFIYTNQTSKEEGMNPLATRKHQFFIENEGILLSQIINKAYELVKSLPEYEGCILV